LLLLLVAHLLLLLPHFPTSCAAEVVLLGLLLLLQRQLLQPLSRAPLPAVLCCIRSYQTAAGGAASQPAGTTHTVSDSRHSSSCHECWMKHQPAVAATAAAAAHKMAQQNF
jgi:hypothetical protein